MSDVRPKIRAAVKRSVRQRCGFGCVICGYPLIEYHHMTPYSQDAVHEAENLTLLCPNHHTDATEPNAVIAESEVRAANANPWALQKGHSAGRQLRYGNHLPSVTIGSNLMMVHPFVRASRICIDNVPFITFRFQDGQLLITAKIIDATGRVLLEIKENEWVVAADHYDFVLKKNRLVINDAARSISLEMEFQPPDMIVIERASLYGRNGRRWTVQKTGTFEQEGYMSIEGSALGGVIDEVRPGVWIQRINFDTVEPVQNLSR